MDFSFNEEQTNVRDLAAKLCEAESTQERLRAIERTPEHFDRQLWGELARAQLLGIGLPEDVGGGGLGFTEICLLLEQVGRATAYVPVLASIAMGALPINQFGTPEQRKRYLARTIEGELILTAALAEAGNDDATTPIVTARPDGTAWRLDGVKECVPYGQFAGAILVPARTGDGKVGVFIVDPSAGGVRITPQVATSNEPFARLELSNARVESDCVLGDPLAGTHIVRLIVDHTLAGLCAIEVGVCESALRMTAKYATTREQFDRPIATFQAVAQRAADAYVDTEAIRLSVWQAAWRLSEGKPASREVAIAKFWAAEGGHRVVGAAQHIHGGMGFDRDYPLHRYYLWSKQIELSLGGANAQLARLGTMLREA